MRFSRDCSTIDFELKFGSIPVSNRSKAETCNLGVTLVVFSVLYFLAVNSSIKTFSTNGHSSLMDTAAGDGSI